MRYRYLLSVSDVACLPASLHVSSAHISIFVFMPIITTFFLIAP